MDNPNDKYYMEGLLNSRHSFANKKELRCWMAGALHALYAYAWWKDGTAYVGTTGGTLKEAQDKLKQQYKRTTGEEWEN